MSETLVKPPEGYLLSRRVGPFTAHNGPLYYAKSDDGVARQAFLAEPHHANGFGSVHGGMLTAFLDGLMVAACIEVTRTPSITIHLSVDFLSSAKVGDWVFGEARVTRATSSILFLEGRTLVDGRDIIRATGVFKVLPSRL